MSFDLAPVELVAGALTAAMLAIPFSFPLAAAAISGPRRTWNTAGLAMGLGLLLGMGLAAAGALAGPGSAPLQIALVVLLVGLVGAIGAGVLVIVLEDGTTVSTVVAVAACLLIGLGIPGRALPALTELSSSVLVVAAAVVIEAVALAAIAGFLVAAAGRVRALQIGVGAAGIVAALLLVIGVWAPLSSRTLLISVLAVLALGSIGGGVLETVRARRGPSAAPGDA